MPSELVSGHGTLALALLPMSTRSKSSCLPDPPSNSRLALLNAAASQLSQSRWTLQ